jgi:hypothetical protein
MHAGVIGPTRLLEMTEMTKRPAGSCRALLLCCGDARAIVFNSPEQLYTIDFTAP